VPSTSPPHRRWQAPWPLTFVASSRAGGGKKDKEMGHDHDKGMARLLRQAPQTCVGEGGGQRGTRGQRRWWGPVRGLHPDGGAKRARQNGAGGSFVRERRIPKLCQSRQGKVCVCVWWWRWRMRVCVCVVVVAPVCVCVCVCVVVWLCVRRGVRGRVRAFASPPSTVKSTPTRHARAQIQVTANTDPASCWDCAGS
jgi:hypothetical protein